MLTYAAAFFTTREKGTHSSRQPFCFFEPVLNQNVRMSFQVQLNQNDRMTNTTQAQCLDKNVFTFTTMYRYPVPNTKT